MRSVERKARNRWSLLHRLPLWGNSPVLSPVRWKPGCRRAPVRSGHEHVVVGGTGRRRPAGARGDGLRRAGPGRARSAAAGRSDASAGAGSGAGSRAEERAPARGAAAREIWWADVPFEDGPGSKDRPCLVLSVRGGTAVVAKITSKHHEERPGVIALPPGSVGDARGRRASWRRTSCGTWRWRGSAGRRASWTARCGGGCAGWGERAGGAGRGSLPSRASWVRGRRGPGGPMVPQAQSWPWRVSMAASVVGAV